MENFNEQPEKIKSKFKKKWIDAGLIDDSKTDEEKYHLSTYLNIAEDILNDDKDNKEYHVVVYPIIVRLNEIVYLRNQSIPAIIGEIKEEYQWCNKEKEEITDFELKFIERFVDNYQKKSNISKHLNALLEALKTGKPND